jgi:hypothetical protein
MPPRRDRIDVEREHMRQHGSQEARARIADRLQEVMKLTDSDVVVDVGSGDGYYSSRFAEYCKKVVALDLACEVFKSQYYSRGNIDTVCENACTWVGTSSWDEVAHVFFSNSFHDLACQNEVLSVLAQGLPVGAHLDMIEFHPETPFGPPKSVRFSHHQLKALLEGYGFQQRIYFDLDTHYFVSFEKPGPE